MDGRGGAGEVVDLIDLEEDRLGDVVADDLEVGMGDEGVEVFAAAGEEVVEAEDLVVFVQEAFAEVGADEAGAAGDEDASGEG